MRTRTVLAAMAFLACVDVGRTTHAQTADRGTAEPAVVRRVEIALAGSPEAYAAFESALHELFGRTRIVATVRLTPEADWRILTERSAPGSVVPLARAFVDLRAQNAVVIVADGPTHDVIERRDLPASGSLEMTVEETSHVIYSVVDSLLRSPHGSTSQREGEAALRPPIPTSVADAAISERGSASTLPQQPTAWGIDGRLFGQLNLPGGSMTLLGVGGGAEMGLRRVALHPGLRLSGAYYAPARAQIDQLEADVHLAAFRLECVFDLFRNASLVVRAGGGGGMDWFRVTPGSRPADGSARGETSEVDPVVTALLDAEIRISSGLSLALGLGLDLDMVPHRYVVRSVDTNSYTDSSLFAPEHLRPSVLAGFSFPVSGSSEPQARSRLEQARR